MVLAALSWSFGVAEAEGLEDKQLALRDFWRHLLTHPLIQLDDGALLDAAAELALDQIDPLGALGETLFEMAAVTTEAEILESVAASFGSRRARCRMGKERFIRANPFDEGVRGHEITSSVLVIDDD